MNPTMSAPIVAANVAGAATRARTVAAANATNMAPTHAGPPIDPDGIGVTESHTQIVSTLLTTVAMGGKQAYALRHEK